jgi:hypothetical protein
VLDGCARASGEVRLANQSFRDQLETGIEFQMIYSTVSAHRLVHFEFSLNDNEFYHSAPTTLGRDQRCYPLLIGGCSIGSRAGDGEQEENAYSDRAMHGRNLGSNVAAQITC